MRALEILGKYFSTHFSTNFPFSFFFQIFLCEASRRYISECLDGSLGCPDDTVDSSGRPFFLSGQACFCDLLRGIPPERHLSSIWTVNPVGLNRILLGTARHFLLSFGSFCRLVHFSYTFYAYFSSARVIFAIYPHPRYVFIPFY
jgi:hypothetical protein